MNKVHLVSRLTGDVVWGRFHLGGNRVYQACGLLPSGSPLENHCQEKRGVLTTGFDSSLIATIADRSTCGMGVEE
jgi:hypothetical protein